MCAHVNSSTECEKLLSYVRLFPSAKESDSCVSSVFSWAEREKLLSYVHLQGRVIYVCL